MAADSSRAALPCPVRSFMDGDTVRCRLDKGHIGAHVNGNGDWCTEMQWKEPADDGPVPRLEFSSVLDLFDRWVEQNRSVIKLKTSYRAKCGAFISLDVERVGLVSSPFTSHTEEPK